MNYLQPERLDRLAREYALGTLSGGARRRFERVLVQAPAAARAVAAWQERFTVLSAGLPPMSPRETVWSGLEQRLFAPPRQSAGWWRWLSGALAGVLLCAVVLRVQPGLIGLEESHETLPASYVGLLTDAQGRPAVLASSRRHGQQLTLKLLQPLVVPPGRMAQLWALPSDGGAPFPVGVVAPGGPSTITLSDSSEKLFFKVSRLAVSLEPAAAQPGSAPTQPFVLSGHCVKLW
ncbi:MAG TPA: anti-sigma factor [Rhizobacter sp.]|nr:anti-sigma factor [Rhizobacter sp.]